MGMDPDRAMDRPGADGSALPVAGEGSPAAGFVKGTSVLVLTRRLGQSVVIPGCRVEIVVQDIHEGAVRLGFKAPDHVDIYRDEIWREMAFDEWNQRSDHDGNQD
jgi:carbon storage regulator